MKDERMKKAKEAEEHIREIISTWDPIAPEQIPVIPLYIDQVTTFMEEYLSFYKRTEEDKIITKTMINNYTKGKVLPPPEKKKYTQAQLMRLILIYHLKQILSITDIGKLLSRLDDEVIEELYMRFVEIQKNMKETLPDHLISVLENTKTSNTTLLFALTLILEAGAYKMVVEELIDIREKETPDVQGTDNR